MRIAIVGGGLAGMATAASLQRQGMTADVFEQAPALGEVGAGVHVAPNAIKALDGIGVGPQIRAAGNRRDRTYWFDMLSGEVIKSVRHDGEEGRYGAPYYVFHRADLLGAVASAVDPSRVHLGHELVGINEKRDTVELLFSGGRSFAADLVIGADGVRSNVRNYLWGADSPQFLGQMVWRSLIPGDCVKIDILGVNTGAAWLGPGAHLSTYYVRGERLFSLAIRMQADEWVDEAWSIPGDPEAMTRPFMESGEPRLKQLLSQVTTCLKWGIFARNPSPQWGRGRIQLVGDAAHAMLPDAAQGASQAFEDAYTISRWIASQRHDPLFALAEFERIRKPRAHAVQLQSAANARMFHARDDAAKQAQRSAFKSFGEEDQIAANFDWIYQHDPVKSWNIVPEVPSFETTDIVEMARV